MMTRLLRILVALAAVMGADGVILAAAAAHQTDAARLVPASSMLLFHACAVLGTIALAERGMIEAASSPPVPEPLIVEDSRPGAGHMQVNHPSPVEGFFQPAVELGRRVQAGELLGTVTDVLGRHSEPIRARYAGLVLVLHTFARVNAADSVAVIL